MEKEFKYEIAFSFLERDEALAYEINDKIKGRIQTFIYSKNQKKLVGADGEEVFSKVFREESRIVVVLYRDGWGKTPWTRIEETAIRGRAYDEGYDFTVFIPLDKPPQAPKYLPKTRIWFAIDHYGVEALPAILETRVQEFGGRIKKESAVEIAEKIKKEEQFKSEKQIFFDSEKGKQEAHSQIEIIWRLVEDQFNQLNAVHSVFGNAKKSPLLLQQKAYYYVYSMDLTLAFEWYSPYRNSLNKSSLTISIYSGLKGVQYPNGYGPSVVSQAVYDFDYDMNKEYRWTNKALESEGYSNEKSC